MLQNSLLIDEEMEYEVAVQDLWAVEGMDSMFEAVDLAMTRLKYPNPNVPEEERVEHLEEVWAEKWSEYYV
tara:strand:+ start:672 stop:884 length:213 start_codon:yes stop_codon:yes gene_type:complete